MGEDDRLSQRWAEIYQRHESMLASYVARRTRSCPDECQLECGRDILQEIAKSIGSRSFLEIILLHPNPTQELYLVLNLAHRRVIDHQRSQHRAVRFQYVGMEDGSIKDNNETTEDDIVDQIDFRSALQELNEYRPEWYKAVTAEWGTQRGLAESGGKDGKPVNRNIISRRRRQAIEWLKKRLQCF